MQSKLAKSVIMMSLSLVIATSTLTSNEIKVNAAEELPSYYQDLFNQWTGGADDYEEDTSIPLEITGPSKIVIYDGDKLSINDLLSKYKASRDGVDIKLNKDKCYWKTASGNKVYMNGTASLAVVSQYNGFDPTFVDIPQHITLESKSWSDGSIARKNITLLVKHNKEKKVNKYVYMRCNVNVHEKPNYESKNLGENYNSTVYQYSKIKKIPYNTKVKVLSEVKVGKYKWLKVKWGNNVGYIFAANASSKKLPTLKTYIHEADAADEAYEKYNYAEMDREEHVIDHNGVKTVSNFIISNN